MRNYPIENWEMEYGDRKIMINGYASYSCSTGTAEFSKVRILEWDFMPYTELETGELRYCVNDEENGGLTEDDLKCLQNIIRDDLNENFELCDYLANDSYNDFD